MKADFARTIVIAAASAVFVSGQTQVVEPRRMFEVASVKANRSGPPTGTWTSPIAFLPGGGFTATNVTLVDVITQAYATRRIQMQGGPDWIDLERFDIIAKADAAEGEVTQAQRLPMVQALLEDRFQLVCHRETKETPALALVGKLSAAVQESKEGQPSASPGDRGKYTFRHWPLAGLANITSNVLRTPVVEGTGIRGYYDFSLDPMQFADMVAAGIPGQTPSYADLFQTALREQLGLRLERRKVPLEIMVIDHASRPTEN